MKINRQNNNQRGIALLFALIALLLLTAIAATMIFSTNIESGVNNNYRSEQQAYFAARAGIEEARIRMLRPTLNANPPAGTGDLCGGNKTNLTCPLLPQNVPGVGGAISNKDMIYIENPGTVNATFGGAVEAVDPSAGNYLDDELCKENYNGYTPANPGKGLRCSSVPVAPWFQKASVVSNQGLADSLDPDRATDRSMSFKWVRIALKQNWNSNEYTVDGTDTHQASPANYNGTTGSPICFDGSKQIVQANIAANYGTNCFPTGTAVDQYRPVYVVTSLAVTPSGSRRYLQAEVGDTPPLQTNASLDTQSIVNINGASVTVNGNDNCKCKCTTGNGNAAPTCTLNSDPSGNTVCNAGTSAIYSTQSVSSGGAVVAPTTTPPTQPILANQSNFPFDVNSLITEYKNLANLSPFGSTCPSGNGCSQSGASYGVPPSPFPPVGDPGAPAQNPCVQPQTITFAGGTSSGPWCPAVTYIPGDGSFSGQLTGAGVLVVDGDLTLTGGAQFYGLIIVRGTLTIKGSGQGQNSNIVGGVITGTGTVTDNTDTLSGGINIQYDSCALNHQQFLAPPSILSMREISY